jgi:hypothetical protein
MVSIAVPTAEGDGRRAATVELNGTVVEGVDHGGGAVAHAELGEDVADMGPHRGLAHVECGPNLGVARTSREEPQHVVFAFGELLEPLGRPATGRVLRG